MTIPPRLAALLAAIDAEITHEHRKIEEHRKTAAALCEERTDLLKPYMGDDTAADTTAALPPPPFPDERPLYKGGSLWTVAGRRGASPRARDMRWRAGADVVEYFYANGSNTQSLRSAGVGTQERGGGWYSVAELSRYCRTSTTPTPKDTP